jgi:hypothetical protein
MVRVCLLTLMLLTLNLITLGVDLRAAEPVFSGPQPGEKLPPFKVQGVLGDSAGKELDFVPAADGKPLVLIFVHDVNRQSISMVRVLSGYTASRAADGLSTGVVFLTDDPAQGEETVKRIQHALAPKAPTGISREGREGPGSYGLNRNVTITILVGNQGKVTANFALVQPSLQVDLPKILSEVVKVAGGKVPPLQDLAGMPAMAERPAAGQDPNLRGLLSPVIRKTATADEVDKAAQAVEAYAAKNPDSRREIGRIANTIIKAGKLTDYGTERAQHYLKQWAKEYGDAARPADSPPAKEPQP